MRTEDLSREQLDALFNRLAPIVNYLRRLEDRMFGLAFDEDDEFYRLVRAAHQAAHAARLQAHFLTCDGMGRARKPRR